jgi:hypothetical protein
MHGIRPAYLYKADAYGVEDGGGRTVFGYQDGYTIAVRCELEPNGAIFIAVAGPEGSRAQEIEKQFMAMWHGKKDQEEAPKRQLKGAHPIR